MFELIYNAGKTLADSFFIGREGENVKTISASEVLPLDVQKKIADIESKFDRTAEENSTEAPVEGSETSTEETSTETSTEVTASKVDVDEMYKKAGVPTPEFIAKSIASVCKDFKGFEQFCKEASENHAKMLKQASLKKEAKIGDPMEFTFNRTEDGKVPSEKLGTEAELSVNLKEVKSDESKGLSDSKKISSPVKSYFSRLPNNGTGEAESTINLQSSLKEQYKKLSAAFEDLKKENEKNKEDLGKANEELGKAKKENEDMKGEMALDSNKKIIDSIVSEIKKIVKVQKENVFVDKLTKLGKDDKALNVVLDVVKEIAKLSKDDKADKDVAGLFGGEEGKGKGGEKGGESFDFDFKAAASKKMPGENIPQVFSQYSNTNLTSLSNLFED